MAKERAMVAFLLEVLFKHKYRILAVTAVVTMVAAVAIVVRPKVYQAETALLVKLGREYLYVPEVGGESARAPSNLGELVNAEMQILNSRDLREQVVDGIGIATLYPTLADGPMALALAKFGRSLTIQTVPNSHVVHVQFRHPDPVLAARAVNVLVDKYLKKRMSIFGRLESEFLGHQARETEGVLQQAHAELEEFKRRNGLYVFQDQFSFLLRERQQYSEQLRATDTKISTLQRKMVTLSDELKQIPETVTVYSETTRNPAVDDARASLLKLRLRELEFAGEYGDQHPAMANIRAELSAVETFLEQQEEALPAVVRTAKSPLFTDLEGGLLAAQTELETLRAERAGLEKQLAEVESGLGAMARIDKQLASLEQTVESHRTAHQVYLGKIREARLAEALDRGKQTNIRIIEAATAPFQPIGLSNKSRLMLAALMGLLLAVGSVFALEWLRATFISPEMVEWRLGLPVLASIPFREGRERVGGGRQLRWRTITLGSALALSMVIAVAATGSMMLLRMPEPLVGAFEGTPTPETSAVSRPAVEKAAQLSVGPLRLRRAEAPPPHQPELPTTAFRRGPSPEASPPSPKMPRQAQQTLASRRSQEPAAVAVPRADDSGETEERAKGAGGERAVDVEGGQVATDAKFPERSFEIAARGDVAPIGSQIVNTGIPKKEKRIERRVTTGPRAGTEIDAQQAARVINGRIEALGSPHGIVAAAALRANADPAPPEEVAAAPLDPFRALNALIAEWPQAAALPAARSQAPLGGLPSSAQESREAPLQPSRSPRQAATDPATPGPAARLDQASDASSLDGRPPLLADHIRVFIHYAADRQGDAALARRLADHLRRRGFTVADIRPVDFSIDNPSVRYFFARDRALSRRLVDELSRFFEETPSRAPDHASDFTHFMPKPRPGNVEVWLPVS